MDRRGDVSPGIHQENGDAVCRHDPRQPAGRVEDETVRRRPFVGNRHGQHTNAVHLARHRDRKGGARTREHAFPTP